MGNEQGLPAEPLENNQENHQERILEQHKKQQSTFGHTKKKKKRASLRKKPAKSPIPTKMKKIEALLKDLDGKLDNIIKEKQS